MTKTDQTFYKRKQAIIAILNRRSIAAFYYFSREYISAKARYEKHLCLSSYGPYPLLDGTPILDSPKFNRLSLKVADMYPSDNEYDAVNDHDSSDDDDKSNDENDDKVHTSETEIDDSKTNSAFEITMEGNNPEDGDEDDNIQFTDTKNEYLIDNQQSSTVTMIRPKKKLRNTSSIRSEEYMMKYEDKDTWTECFL